METYKNALKEIRNQTSQINIIDVGCARGAFLRHVKDFFSDGLFCHKTILSKMNLKF